MTCREMGGPCDKVIEAGSEDEMMNKGAEHVREMADQGDEEHKKVVVMMDDMQANPDSEDAKNWGKKFHEDYEAAAVVEE